MPRRQAPHRQAPVVVGAGAGIEGTRGASAAVKPAPEALACAQVGRRVLPAAGTARGRAEAGKAAWGGAWLGFQGPWV